MAHTNTRFSELGFAARPAATPHGGSNPFPGEFYETPATLACLYGLVTPVSGCNPNTFNTNATGGSKVVAIVDAYDDPTALSDLQAYSLQFGLPAPRASTFQVVYAGGSQPVYDSGWAGEEALDTQMVHALAPKAKIILVEAASSSTTDLFVAEQAAARLVAAAGGGEITNSWGMGEFSGETSSAYTAPFTGTSAVFFASTGDSQTPEFPAILPGVVAVGGTSVGRNPNTGNFLRWNSWDLAGAGTSLFVARPSFQAGMSGVVGSTRGVPDVALVANPDTGVFVYQGGYWYVYGGTSVAAPLMAAITNAAGHFATSTSAELTAIYANAKSTPASFTDVLYGYCGTQAFYIATAGYDLCTGLGGPANLKGE